MDRDELIRKGVVDGRKAFVGPEHVVIDLTNRCNNNCIACWTRSPLLGDNSPDKDWHKQQLETELVLQLIDDLARMGTSIIRFTGGGEPFLHPDIYTLIRAVKKKNIFCAVTTSLNMVGKDDVEELLQSGLDEISVSLWAANATDYVLTHPNKTAKTFLAITEVLQAIAAKKSRRIRLPFLKTSRQTTPRVNILNVISRVNCAHVEQMYDYALRVRAESVYFAVVDPVPGSTDSLLLGEEERFQVRMACENIERRNARMAHNKKIFLDNFSGFRQRIAAEGAGEGNYDFDEVDALPCYIGWIFCRILASGEVAPCCRGVHLPMGNLHEASFSEIWNSEKYNGFRFMAKNLNKRNSWFKNIGCGTTCDNHMHNQELQQRLFTP
ncbi:MAG: radical SAM protein [Proteobacteria bacterium]|nr:radical SAM protein [Pseudomonadota bacterium]